MRPADIRRIRQRLRITQQQLAALLGVHPVTVRNGEAGMQPIRKTHALHMRLIARQALWRRKR
jgi:DNA-binding transcriptional regulator YiaG